MKNPFFLLVGSLLLLATIAPAQTKLDMPVVGQSLPSADFKLVNKIPKSHLAAWPKSLPVFRYSAKPSQFRIEDLQKLIDESVFAGTNLNALLGSQTNLLLLSETVRLATQNGLDSFFADPSRGSILLQQHGYGVDLRKETPPYDGVPSFETISNRVMQYAQMFGVSTNEMERREDGTIRLLKTDGKTLMRGGAINFISRRSVGVSRCAAGYVFIGNSDKIELILGVNGYIEQFRFIWPAMEAVRTNKLLTIDRVLEEIKRGNILGDVSNEYPADGIAQITLKDARIEYYAYSPRGFGAVSTNTDVFPLISFHAVFKSKSGKTEEGGLYAPILDSK
jgi:hypothetical protein